MLDVEMISMMSKAYKIEFTLFFLSFVLKQNAS